MLINVTSRVYQILGATPVCSGSMCHLGKPPESLFGILVSGQDRIIEQSLHRDITMAV